MSKKTSPPPSIDQLAQQQSDSDLIGRDFERQTFQQNLLAPRTPQPIFSIHGQGGIGKTFLLRHYLSIAEQKGIPAAYTDEDQHKPEEREPIVKTMSKLAQDLADRGFVLPCFTPKNNIYWQAAQEIDADPDAPQGFFDTLGRVGAAGALSILDKTPAGPIIDGVQAAAGLKDDEIVKQAGALASYLAKKFRGKRDTIALLKDPVGLLTPLFVQDINQLAACRPVLLCFDTWEWTCKNLDGWLLGLLKTHQLSAGVRLVVAGRHPLGDTLEPYWPVIAGFELTEFTETETRAYVARQGITDERRIADILHFSGGVPVLVATLSGAQGGDPGEAADSLVDRYLKWIDDPQRRRVALACAAARRLDQDVLGVVAGDGSQALFDWLIEQPFVKKRAGGWEYHPQVRRLMQRYGRERSTGECRAVHGKLRDHYLAMMANRPDAAGYRDERWRQHALESLYHDLMQETPDAIGRGLDLFLLALGRYYPLAAGAVGTWQQAAEDLEDKGQIQEWAQHLILGFIATMSGTYAGALPLCAALAPRGDLSPEADGNLYFLQALAHGELHQYEAALADYTRAVALNPQDAVAYNNRGNTYHTLKQFEQALADYTRAIALNPQEAVAYSNRGNTYHALKHFEQALADYTRAIALNPEYATAFYNRGRIYDEQGEYERAIEDYDRAIELNPEDADAYLDRGLTYGKQGEYERAIEDYDRTIELNPEGTNAYFGRGLMYHELGAYERAVEDYDHAIQLDPQYAGFYYRRGSAFHNQGDYRRAIEDYDCAIQLDPEYPTTFYNRGRIYDEQGEYERAIEDYDRAIELNPEDADAYISRGLACYAFGEYGRAIEDYDCAIQLDPEYPTTFYNRGRIYDEQGEYERAIEDYDRAIELNPEDADAYISRGRVYDKQGEYERAIEDYDRAIELNPEDADAYISRGLACYAFGEYERAMEDYACAIERNPEGTNAYLARGLMYHELGAYERAIEDYDRAIQLDPQYDGFYYERGLVYHKQGDYTRAIADYDQAIQINPEHAAAYYNKACAYALMENVEQACRWLARAIDLDEKYGQMAQRDTDFDRIREDKRFQDLLSSSLRSPS